MNVSLVPLEFRSCSSIQSSDLGCVRGGECLRGEITELFYIHRLPLSVRCSLHLYSDTHCSSSQAAGDKNSLK